MIRLDLASTRLAAIARRIVSWAPKSCTAALVQMFWLGLPIALAAGPELLVDTVAIDPAPVLQGQGRTVIVSVSNPGTEAVNITSATLRFQTPRTWVERTGLTTQPDSRRSFAMTYDPARKQTVLFGGIGASGRFDDTWLWSGTAWTSPTSGTPDARTFMSLAYDSKNQNSVFFGGFVTNGNTRDNGTWAWNGSTWALASITTRPSNRSAYALSHDAARERLVFFGGLDNNGDDLSDTWEWDGSSAGGWSQVSLSSRPSGRESSAMAYDARRRKSVLFGGDASGTEQQDTWEYDGAWRLVDPSSKPPARRLSSMAYDSSRRRVVLFAGRMGGSKLADLWEYDGVNWQEISIANGPDARENHAVAYDSERSKLIVFGGTDTGPQLLQDTWELGGGDVTNEYQVSPFPDNPTSIAAGSTATLRFDVRISDSATTGTTITVDGRLAGSGAISAASVSDLGATTAASWSVATPTTAVLELVSVVTIPTFVSRGQSGIRIAMSVRNTGQSTAVLTASTPTFAQGPSDVSTQYTVTATATNATSISSGATAVLTYTVAVSSGATTGSIKISGAVTGTDAINAVTVEASGATSTDSWTVQTPAALSVGTISATPTLVSRGQTGISVSMTVSNTGQATATIGSAALKLTSPSDVTSQYTIVASGGNPTSISGGQTETFTFTVAVGASATLGSITIDGSVTGEDANSGASLTGATASTKDSWTVQTPGAISVETVTAIPTTVSRGQTGIAVTVTLRNTGQAAVNAASSGLKLSNGGDVTSQYAVASGSNPSVVSGGAVVTHSFTVGVGSSATLGAVTIDATATAVDSNTGSTTSDNAAANADSWTVQTPGALTIGAVVAEQASVDRGEGGLAVRMGVTNSGGATVAVVLSQLEFSIGGTDVGSQYTVTADPSNATSLSGGASATLTYSVAVSASATPGVVVLDGAVSGTEGNTGATVSDSSAATTDSWIVIGPAALSVGTISTTATQVGRGESGIPVTMSVSNTGEATASILSAALEFDLGGDVTSQYSATPAPGNPTSVDGGSTVTLQFTVAVGGAASAGAVTLDGAVTGADSATADPLSDGSADVTDSWTVLTPAALSIDSILVSTATLTQGDANVTVRMAVTNTGQDSLTITTSQLSFTSGALDVSSEYSVSGGGTPALSGGASATLTFTVAVASTATTGTIAIDGQAGGIDRLGGTVSDAGAAAAGSWTVQASPPPPPPPPVPDPAELAIDSIETSAGFVSQGQAGIAVRMAVSNTGGTTATMTAAALTFRSAADVTDQYTSTASGLGASIGVGESRTVTFTVAVSPGAAPGTVSIDGTVAGTDAGTGGSVSDTGATTTDSWVVQIPAGLELARISSALSEVRKGQSATVMLEARNPGQATASLTAASLRFLGAAQADISSRFSVTPAFGLPFSLPGGTTSTLAFDVTVSPTTEKGAVTIDGALAGSDANSGAPVADGSAAVPHGWIVLNSPPVAVIAPVSRALAGVPLTLSATGSADADATDTLSFEWTLEQGSLGRAFAPNGSAAAGTTTCVPSVAGDYRVSVAVSDGEDVTTASVSFTAVASVPFITAIPATTLATVGVPVTLTASAQDPAGDALAYRWTFAAKPGASALTPESLATSGGAVTFTPDASGSYTLRLVVSTADGRTSAARTADVFVAESVTPAIRPQAFLSAASLANAGAGKRPRTVRLEGGSTGGAAGVAYLWQVTQVPAGAVPATTFSTSITYRMSSPGDYSFRFTAFNSAGVSSQTTTLRVEEVEPTVLFATGDQMFYLTRPDRTVAAQTTTTVKLDASPSRGPNGTPIVYSWRAIPPSTGLERLVTFDSANAPAPVATFDQELIGSGPGATLRANGDWRFACTASSGGRSTTASVLVRVIDPISLLPTADAGLPQSVRVKTSLQPAGSTHNSKPVTASLVGSTSRDRVPQAKQLNLRITWNVLFKPRISDATTILDAFSPIATLVTTSPGIFTVGLSVTRLATSAGLKTDAGPLHAQETVLGTSTSQTTVNVVGAGTPPDAQFHISSGEGFNSSTIGRPRAIDGDETAFGAGALAICNVGTAGNQVEITLDALGDLTGRPQTTDPDPGDQLEFRWVQTAGPEVLVTGQTASRVTFLTSPDAPPIDAVYGFKLFVTDSQDNVTSAVGNLVTIAGGSEDAFGAQYYFERSLDVFASNLEYDPDYASRGIGNGKLDRRAAVSGHRPIRLRSSASTTAATGEELRPQLPARSLRVTLPTTVTLTAFADTGIPYDITWRQLAGPVVLSSTSKTLAATGSATTFAPTTSGNYLFEARMEARPRPAPGTLPPGPIVRYIRVLVDSPESSVPEARLASATATIFATGTVAQRTAVLDGRPTVEGLSSPGATLRYQWRQVAGPIGDISDPNAPVTSFTAPVLPGGGTAKYMLELTVAKLPPGDRSEPVYVQVSQQGSPGTPAPAASSLVNLFIGGVRLAAQPGQLNADGSASVAGVTIPTGTADGALMTLERVAADGSRLSPPQVLRSYTLTFGPSFSDSLVLGASGTLFLSSSLVGGPAVSALVLATGASAGAPIGAFAVTSDGGGGCSARKPGDGAGLDLLLLSLVGLAALRRRRAA